MSARIFPICSRRPSRLGSPSDP